MSNTDFDLVCIGAGPSNLSLAIALEELAPEVAERTLVVERAAEVSWQPGMLLPSTESQVHFLKDLAFLRNPRSRYTFTNFLHESGRLNAFLALGTLYPYRHDIADYLRWVADNLERVQLALDANCRAVALTQNDGAWKLDLGSSGEVTCRTLILGVGRSPNIPREFKDVSSDRAIHSSTFKSYVDAMLERQAQPNHVCVLGAGQSGVEMAMHVADAWPAAKLTVIHRSPALTAYSTSPFMASHYSSASSKRFYTLSDERRGRLLDSLQSASYSGATPDTLDAFFRLVYRRARDGETDIRVMPSTTVEQVVEDGDHLQIIVRDVVSDGTEQLTFDVVLLGTGYTKNPHAFMGTLPVDVVSDPLHVSENYEVRLAKGVEARLFVQGTNEKTHGISDSLLSNMSERAESIVREVLRGAVQ